MPLKDLVIYRLVKGDDWVDVPITITFEDGTPYPLSGKTITGEILLYGNRGVIPLSILYTDPTSGAFSYTAVHTNTVNLPLGVLSKMRFLITDGNTTQTLFCMAVEGVECL